MALLTKNRKYKNIGNTIKTTVGSVALMAWLLLFFAGSLKANSQSIPFTKSAKTVVVDKTSPSKLPTDPSEPLPLPEDPESNEAELDDEVDNDKRFSFTAYLIQLVVLQQTAEIQAVQSFHYNQSIQQRIAIPLFILHHSWKSYLV